MQDVTVSCITPCFRGERYLAGFLENLREQTILERIEVVLDHNEPAERELTLIERFQSEHPGILTHMVTRPVQPIGRSMNRCIDKARGKYVAIWNVDDMRTPDSLELQVRVLEENPGIALAYGDFIIVNGVGATGGRLVSPPSFDRRVFMRGMHCGPFPMWRRDIHAVVGYFDEQLLQAADFDLMIRVASRYKMERASGLLGYYLDEGKGLSTRRRGLQPLEGTVIDLRYGNYDKIDYWYRFRTRNYHIYEIKEGTQWVPVNRYVPHYEDMVGRARMKSLFQAWKLMYQVPYHLAVSLMSRMRRAVTR